MSRARSPIHTSLVTCLLCIVPELPGQVADTWEPVPKEDLALKDNPVNPGSPAMILERQLYTDDEKRFQTEQLRIKVFAEEGKAYADVEIPYFAKSTTIGDIRGRTVRPDGTVITFNGTVFDKVVAKYRRLRYEAKAFTLPGVEVGSVIECAYTMRWKESLPDYVRVPPEQLDDLKTLFRQIADDEHTYTILKSQSSTSSLAP
jgi:hypothetical protein